MTDICAPLKTKTANSRLPRSYKKCEECRVQHLKCLPVDRDWSKGQKCDKCEKAGKACGENTTFSKSQINQPGPLNAVPTPPPSCNHSFTQASETLHRGPAAVLSSRFSSVDDESSANDRTFLRDEDVYQRRESDSLDKFNAARAQLQEIAGFGELFEYFCDRATAVDDLRASFPMLDLDSFVCTLNFTLLAITNLAVLSLRTIDRFRVHISETEQELLSLRTLNALQPVLAYRQLDQRKQVSQSSIYVEVEALIKYLVERYEIQGHYAEAPLIATIACRRRKYLDGYNIKMLECLSQRLCTTFLTVCRDIPKEYQDAVAPKGELRIGAGHLAMLGGRLDFSIEPWISGLTFKPDILNRNELHLGAEKCDFPYVKWAISCAKNSGKASFLETRDRFGLTAMMIAIYRGCVEIFRLLVDEGASLAARDPQGKNILSLASIAGHTLIIKEIMKLEFPILDSSGVSSPIHEAAAAGSPADVIRLLLYHEADPREPRVEHNFQRASQIAGSKGHETIACVLEQAESRLDRAESGEAVLASSQALQALERASPGQSSSSSSSQLQGSPNINTRRPRKRFRPSSHRNSSPATFSTTAESRVSQTGQYLSPMTLARSCEDLSFLSQSIEESPGSGHQDFVNPMESMLHPNGTSYVGDSHSHFYNYSAL